LGKVSHYHLVFRDRIAAILIPGWSLNYEIFFYLIFAVGLLVRSRRARLVMTGGILAAFAAFGFWLKPHNAIAVEMTNVKLLLFGWGVGLAALYVRGVRVTTLFGAPMVVLGVLLFVATTWAGLLPAVLDETAFAPLLVVMGTLALEALARRFPSRYLKLLGDASYALYLSHPFALKFPELAWDRLHLFGSLTSDLVYFALCLVCAIALAVVVHWWIEQPILT
jgi:exopolysaccharide production protein ExoZ